MSEAIEEVLEIRPRRFRPYPRYADCALGEVAILPAHWRLEKLKHVAAVRFSNVDKKTEGGEVAVRLCNYVDVYYRDVIDETIEFMEATASSEEIRKFALRQGDVLITKDSESWDDIAVSAWVATDLEGVLCGYHLAQIRPHNGLRGDYLARCFAASGILDQFRVAATGITRFGLSNSSIDDAVFPVPPIEEQGAIASFLDRETAKIDALVAKKERLIELLQEKRTALITRTVTKGLDPSVPMKDSGVEIPAHWAVKRLWHLTPIGRRIMYGIVLPGPNVDEGVPIVKGGDVSAGRLNLERLNRTTYEIEAPYVRSRLRGGDLVYAIRGSIGEVEMVPDELEGANLTQDAARVAYTDKVHGRWLLYALRSTAVFAQLEAGALGATIRGINIRDLKRALLPVPPPPEQVDLADFLKAHTARIDGLIDKIREGVERIKEFRTALISAAVTGKIDVREEAA